MKNQPDGMTRMGSEDVTGREGFRFAPSFIWWGDVYMKYLLAEVTDRPTVGCVAGYPRRDDLQIP